MNAIDITLVRWIHAISGIVWFGVSFFAVIILHPYAQKSDKGRFLMQWYTQSSMSKIFPVAAILTTLGGLYITGRLFVAVGGPWRSELAMNILYFGMVVGLLAFGHGIGLGAQIARYSRSSKEALATAGAVATDLQESLDKQERSLMRSSWASFGLTTVAILCMTLAPHI